MAANGSITIRIDGDASPFERTLNSIGDKSKRIISGIGTVSKGVAKGATVVYGAISAAKSVAGVASVKYNANIERLQTSFATMTGSAEKAADILRYEMENAAALSVPLKVSVGIGKTWLAAH